MPQHDVQVVLDGKSVILKLDDKALHGLEQQFKAGGHGQFVTVTDVDGNLHCFGIHHVTAITTPKNHDLCGDSTDKLIDLFKLGVITEEELRTHFGLPKKVLSPNVNVAAHLLNVPVVPSFMGGGSIPYTISGNGGATP